MEVRISLDNYVKIIYNICLQVDMMNKVEDKYQHIIDQYRDIVLSSNVSMKDKEKLIDMIPGNVTDIINIYFRPTKLPNKSCCCGFF